MYGLVVGVTVGWLARPLLRWWLTVEEWRNAAREAAIAEELLRRMAPTSDPTPDPRDPEPESQLRR